MAKKLTHLIKYVFSTRKLQNFNLEKRTIERKRSVWLCTGETRKYSVTIRREEANQTVLYCTKICIE